MVCGLIQKLLDIVPGPDFPTFGEIVGRQGSRDLHKRGKGSVKLRGKAEIIATDRGKQAIIITELPYMVVKSGKGIRANFGSVFSDTLIF